MFKKKPTASEVDGVQYRRAKTWQIICYACNGLVGMSVYSLIGMASYSASIGYGITTAAVGIILTCSRILDGITDPLLAFVYDRVNTKFGKLKRSPFTECSPAFRPRGWGCRCSPCCTSCTSSATLSAT